MPPAYLCILFYNLPIGGKKLITPIFFSGINPVILAISFPKFGVLKFVTISCSPFKNEIL